MKGFKKFLAIYIASFVVIGAIGLGVFYSFIGAFEKSRPEAFLTEYLDSGLPSGLAKCAEEFKSDFSGTENNTEFVTKLFSEAEAFKVKDNSYSIREIEKESQKELAVIELEEVKGKFGFSEWKIKNETYNIEPWLESAEIALPDGYTAYVNGIPLEKQHIIESNVKYQLLSDAYNDCENLPTLTKYKSSTYLGPASIEVKDPSGKLLNDYSEYNLLPKCDDKTTEEIDAFCADFIYKYMAFVGNINPSEINYNYSRLRQIVKDDSQMYELMSYTYAYLNYAKTTDWKLYGVKLNHCFELSEGKYFADLTYDAEITSLGDPIESTNYVRLIIERNDRGVLLTEAMYSYTPAEE